MRPIEEGCGCPACQTYSRAYIRHLLESQGDAWHEIVCTS